MTEMDGTRHREALLAKAKRSRQRAARYRDVAFLVGNRRAADAMRAEAELFEREADGVEARAASPQCDLAGAVPPKDDPPPG
jgi:hypothetical protein